MRRIPFLSVLFALFLTLAVPNVSAAPKSAECAGKETPPPAVDSSEKPAPGQTAPAPLPVPDKPVGGEKMGECGVILPKNTLNPPETSAASWVLQDLDSGAILAAKDPHARQRPASLIKTLLALVALKELKTTQVITATKDDANQECTCVGLVEGGKYTVDQLMHGLLMHSGNDAAHALATALGGVPTALQKMNAHAVAIGATDTRAATPSGLDGPGMTSSAYDLSLIFHQAMKEPSFAKAIKTKKFEFPATGGKPAFPVFNDNKLLGSFPGFLGGKTGFTDDARHTYVGGAEQNGRRLALVLMRAEQRPTRVSDQATQLLEYGFSLAKNNPEPVGQIVQLAAANATGEAVNQNGDGNSAQTHGEDRFGVTGWIITLLVALIIVAGFVIGRRQKQLAAAAQARRRPISDDERLTRPIPRQR